MNSKLAVLALLLAVCVAVPYSPSWWLQRGFDVSDGRLEQFPDYNLQLETTCKDVNLNKQGTPYNYNGTVMSGYLKINKGASVLSFIFYGQENQPSSNLKNVPTILWLSGGPGASSQLGNLMQLGPFRVIESQKKSFDVVRNDFAWTKNYNVLFLDQPVGTGLSYADPKYPKAYVTNMTEVAIDAYEALKELYNSQSGCFQKLGIRGDHPLFIVGQSYGGKYAPAIGEKILKEASDNKGFLTGLKGVAIADGFTNPFSTLSLMGEYAYNLGLLDFQERSKIEQVILNSSYQFLNERYTDLHKSFWRVVETIGNNSFGTTAWDVTKYKFPPTGLLDSYFASDEVLSMYQLDPSVKYNSQASNVYEALYDDFMKRETQLVQNILMNYNAKVLVYTGQNDLVCNTPGTLRWVESLMFADGEAFRNSLMFPYSINKNVKGFFKRIGKLELRTINDAGHLAARDQGEVALFAISEFIKNAIGEGNKETVANVVINQ